MCGLVGIASTLLDVNDKKCFAQMLEVDAVRGHHSTGIFGVDKGQAEMYKRALNSQDFLQLQRTHDIINNKNTHVLVGHNRWATKGAVNHKNAHPFSHGNITLVHNGSLTRTNNLPDHGKFTVDSENIAWAFNKDGAVATIPKLHGAFSIIWHDAETNTLNFVRNEERPMWVATTEFEDIIFASEPGMLSWICSRNTIKVKEMHELDTGKIYTHSLEDFNRDPVVTDVDLRDPNEAWYQTYNNTTPYRGRKNTGPLFNAVLSKYKLKMDDTLRVTCTSWTKAGFRGTFRGVTVGDVQVLVEGYAMEEEDCIVGNVYLGVITAGIAVGVDDIIRLRTIKPVPLLGPVLETIQVLGVSISLAEYANRIKDGCAFCASPFSNITVSDQVGAWRDADSPMHDICFAVYQDELKAEGKIE